MKTWKRYLPDVVVVVVFALISFAYFFVPVTQGKILYRHDASAGVGSAQELTEYQNRTGETTRWTNSIFGGMPTYQMSPSYQSTDGLSQVMNAYHLWLPENVWFLFAYLLGFYILLRAFDFRQSLAALGSVMWAFSSYFRCWSPLEGNGFGLSAAYDSGYSTGLSRALPVWFHRDSHLHRL